MTEQNKTGPWLNETHTDFVFHEPDVHYFAGISNILIDGFKAINDCDSAPMEVHIGVLSSTLPFVLPKGTQLKLECTSGSGALRVFFREIPERSAL